MRRYRVDRATTLRIRRYEKRGPVIIDFRHQAVRWRSRLARDGATLQHVSDMIRQPGTDPTPDHIRRENRGIASPPRDDVLRALRQCAHDRVHPHLPHDRALA